MTWLEICHKSYTELWAGCREGSEAPPASPFIVHTPVDVWGYGLWCQCGAELLLAVCEGLSLSCWGPPGCPPPC